MYSTSQTQAKKSIGCAKCYIKMAVTTYTAKLELPKMAAAEDGMDNVRLAFDWSPMTDGGRAVWDKTVICVEIKNGEQVKVIPIDPINKQDGLIDGRAITPYQWHHVDIALDECVINKDTRIALRNADPDFPQTETVGIKKRWFLDNIKVYTGSSTISEIVKDENAPVEYFNLQGVKITKPEYGVYIRRQGSDVTKVTVK